MKSFGNDPKDNTPAAIPPGLKRRWPVPGPSPLPRWFAVYAICSRWHSGGPPRTSRGYSLMCLAGILIRRLGIERPLDQINLKRPEFRHAFMHYYRRLWPHRMEL